MPRRPESRAAVGRWPAQTHDRCSAAPPNPIEENALAMAIEVRIPTILRTHTGGN